MSSKLPAPGTAAIILQKAASSKSERTKSWDKCYGCSLLAGTGRLHFVRRDHQFCIQWHSESKGLLEMNQYKHILFMSKQPSTTFTPSSASSQTPWTQDDSAWVIKITEISNSWSCLVKILKINSMLGRVVLSEQTPPDQMALWHWDAPLHCTVRELYFGIRCFRIC